MEIDQHPSPSIKPDNHPLLNRINWGNGFFCNLKSGPIILLNSGLDFLAQISNQALNFFSFEPVTRLPLKRTANKPAILGSNVVRQR